MRPIFRPQLSNPSRAVNRDRQILLRSPISFCSLYRGVVQQQLNLFKHPAGPKIAAHPFDCGDMPPVNARDYPGAIRPGLSEVPISRLSRLTPASWANTLTFKLLVSEWTLTLLVFNTTQ